jgi:chromosome segregation ATPase
MKPNQISSESVGDIISNLQSRVITLQNQYINFVSYCTDLIKYHKKNLYYELNSDTNLNNLPQAVCKHLESLEEGYRVATTNLDFSVITNNAHEALNKAQIKVVSIFKKHLSEKEAEIKISSVFSSLSEVICRKLFRKNRKSHSSKSVNPFLIENSGEAKFSNITNDTFIASEKKLYLEKQISDMNIINKQDLEQKKPNQIKNFINKTRFSSTESNKVRSNYVSPVLSPLSKDNLEESYIKTSKPQDFSITKSIGNMCRLLNSLNVIISALEKIPEILPDQKQAIKAFYQTKNDLFRSIQNFISNYKAIINPETNLEADLEKKNYEIKYLTNQLKDLTQGVSNTLTELKQLKAANISLKKTVSTLEAKNENLINKIAFNNSKIEKFEKNNKSLQDCLSLQKNNLKSSKNGKNKCETVVLNKKNKIRDAIAIVRDSSVSITPIKKPLSSFCVEFQGFINIAADAQLEFDNSFVMRNLKGGSIKDKIKICEDILLDRLEIEKTPEYLNLNRKYSVLIAEKNLLEEDIIKLKNNLVKTEAENTDLNKKVYQKTEICKVLEELVNKFKTKKSCTDLKIETIFNISYKSSNQESLLNLNSSIEFYIQENTELNKRLNELEKSTQILKSDNIKLHDHNLTQQKQYSLLEKQYSVSEHHIKTYKQELNNINSLINSIKDSKQLLYNQIQFLELENSKLTEKISHIDHTSNLQYTKAHEKDKKIYEDLIQNLSNSLNIASKENSEVKSELKKLLDCKNALLSQFNIQSQELNEFKIEQERLLQQIKDQSNQISIYQGQIHELNNTQSTLNLGIAENVEKNETLSKEIEEKNSEIEILHKDMLELRFKNSVVSHDSSELFKEEIYKLKVKNISLEQTIQEFKNSQGNCEVHKTLLVPEDTRKVLEKKIKDLETVLIKEKEASQKSFDSFAKQLTGANLETHTLRSKVSELTQKYCPIFTSSEDYKIIIAVSYENNSWYLIENMIENDYTWVDASNLKPINENISFYDLAQLKSFESNSEGPESNLNDSYRQQQKISQKELSKKNDIIKNYEDNIAVLKEKNNRYVRDLEKYEHLRVLIARFRELKPILNSECSAVMEMIISMADLSKKNRSAGNVN